METSILGLVMIIIYSFIVWVPFIFKPEFHCDLGFYASCAKRWLEGKIPYKDTPETKPVGILLLYALIQKFIGRSLKCVIIIAAVYNIFTTIVIFFLAKYLFGTEVAYISSLIYATLSASPVIEGNYANCETFLVFPMTASFLLFLIGAEKSFLTMFCSGILAGVSTLIKQTAIFNLIAIYLSMILFPNFINNLLSFSVGVISIQSIPISYFLYKKAIKDYFFWNLWINLSGILNPYSSYNIFHPKSLKEIWKRWLRNAIVGCMPVLIIGFCSGFFILFFNPSPERFAFILWFLFSIFPIFLKKIFALYYFVYFTPALSIASGYGVFRALDEFFRSGMHFTEFLPFLGFCIVSVLLLLFLLDNIKNYLPVPWSFRGRWRLEHYLRHKDAQRLIEYIKDTTTSNDSIVVWASSAEITYETGRRFPGVCPSNVRPVEFSDQWFFPEIYYRPFIEDCRENPPEIIVVNATPGGLNLDYFQNLTGSAYRVERIFGEGDIVVFRRTNSGRGGSALKEIEFHNLSNCYFNLKDLLSLIKYDNEKLIDKKLGYFYKAIKTYQKKFIGDNLFYWFIIYQRLGLFNDKDIRLTLDKTTLDLFYKAGVVLFQKGFIDKAIEQFLEILETFPNHIKTRYQLGKAYFEKGKILEAKQVFNTLLKIKDPSSSSYYGGAHYYLGLIYERQNEIDKAKLEYTKCLAFSPNHEAAKLHLFFCETFSI
jgi:tetratricopeptide (TPR) repeat protein